MVQSIRENLEPLCHSFQVGEDEQLLKLSRFQHLVSRFEGTLHAGVSELDLLYALHPTPAVGGYPGERAVQALAHMESFDRGWYTGPVGWVAAESAEFAVAIRCGLVEGQLLHLYSGAGIVTGSTAQDEWDEVENKIGDFIQVLAPR